MKLSISALLLATVLATANAATNTASDVNGVKCIRPNNIGAGDGYGYGGYCCKTDDDCRVGCVNKICNGPGKFDFTANPANSGSSIFPQCLEAKNAGSGKKSGWKGYCCKNNNDCKSSCSKHVCTGKENPIYLKPVPTGKSTTTKKSGSTTCTRPNNRGEGEGRGWNGYCCKTSDDCKDTCIKGVCNGKANPKFASPITTTKKSGSTTCTRPNNRGEGEGRGWNGYCCKTSDDCKDTCIKGVCNGKLNPKFA